KRADRKQELEKQRWPRYRDKFLKTVREHLEETKGKGDCLWLVLLKVLDAQRKTPLEVPAKADPEPTDPKVRQLMWEGRVSMLRTHLHNVLRKEFDAYNKDERRKQPGQDWVPGILNQFVDAVDPNSDDTASGAAQRVHLNNIGTLGDWDNRTG